MALQCAIQSTSEVTTEDSEGGKDATIRTQRRQNAKNQSNREASHPMNMKRKQAVVIKAPLLDGDSIPSMATTATHRAKKTPASALWGKYFALYLKKLKFNIKKRLQ